MAFTGYSKDQQNIDVRAVHVKFIAEQVVWVDAYGNQAGPGTVTDARKVLDKLPGVVLDVLNHQTGLYEVINSKRAEVIVFDEDRFEALPEMTKREIQAALEYGKQCSFQPDPAVERCTDSRLFGEDVCVEHSDPDWPYTDRAELEDWI